MKKINVIVHFDDYKIKALQIYLEKKGATIEDYLVETLDSMYEKNVPSGVRDYLQMTEGSNPSESSRVKRKSKEIPPNITDDSEGVVAT